MTRGEGERLLDIRDAIVSIREHVERARSVLGGRDDPLLHDALLFQFVVIGEAVKNLEEGHGHRRRKCPGRTSLGSAT